MSTLKLTSTNDLYVGESGNMVLLTGLDGVIQDCENKMKGQLGEMMYQTDAGLPYMDFVFQSINLNAFRASAITQLLEVPNVLDVVSFDLTKVGETVTYKALIQTAFGLGVLNGDN